MNLGITSQSNFKPQLIKANSSSIEFASKNVTFGSDLYIARYSIIDGSVKYSKRIARAIFKDRGAKEHADELLAALDEFKMRLRKNVLPKGHKVFIEPDADREGYVCVSTRFKPGSFWQSIELKKPDALKKGLKAFSDKLSGLYTQMPEAF